MYYCTVFYTYYSIYFFILKQWASYIHQDSRALHCHHMTSLCCIYFSMCHFNYLEMLIKRLFQISVKLSYLLQSPQVMKQEEESKLSYHTHCIVAYNAHAVCSAYTFHILPIVSCIKKAILQTVYTLH